MTIIQKHAPGEFCWIELSTSNQSAAKDFYAQIFGWTPNDTPMGPNETYTIFKLQDRDAAGAYTLRPEEASHGVPPHWNLYVAVESADACAAKATELGGKVLAPPFDVMDAGRITVVQDPTGAVICIWQAKKNVGTQIAGLEGTLCWADLSTPDRESAGQFYSGLFGWTMMKEDEDSAHNYWHIKNGEEFIGGIPPASHLQKGVPPHWLPYFTVTDCDATSKKANQFGAKIYMPPTDFENVGRISIIADPQGATFAIFKAAARSAKSA